MPCHWPLGAVKEGESSTGTSATLSLILVAGEEICGWKGQLEAEGEIGVAGELSAGGGGGSRVGRAI